MKKFFSLVLAAIMVMSAFVFVSGALEPAFSDDFDDGFKPVNWIQGDSCSFRWDKGSNCIVGYEDAVALQSNFSSRDKKMWATGYMSIDFQIRDFDDLGTVRYPHRVGIWYRDLFENDDEGKQTGAVYVYYIEIETGRALLTKTHTWNYRDYNGILQEMTVNNVIAETYLDTSIQVSEYAPFYEFGWRITKGKIECYFNEKLVLTASADPSDTKYGDFTKNSVDETVGTQKSPFIFFNEGNYVALDNFEVWNENYIPGHKIEVVGRVEPTCVEDGYSGDYICTECGMVFEYGEIIHATGEHNTKPVGYIAPSCTKDGYTGDYVCADCGEVIEYGETLPTSEHKYYGAVTDSIDPERIYVDCNFTSMSSFTQDFYPGAFWTEDGILYGYFEAKALQSKGEWYTYDTSIKVALNDDDFYDGDRAFSLWYCNSNLDAYGLYDGINYMRFGYDIENEEFFLTAYDINTGEIIDLVPRVSYYVPDDEWHTFGLSVNRGQLCGFIDNVIVIDYVDNNDTYLIGLEDGNTQPTPVVFWNDGNYVQGSNIKIAESGTMLSNSDSDGEGSVKPTCTTDGYSGSKKCRVCGEVKPGEIIPATGHQNTEIIGNTPPTCTEAGTSGITYCHDCESVVSNNVSVPATGHILGEWVIIAEPTDTTEGLQVKNCMTCGEMIEKEIIPVIKSYISGDATNDGKINLGDVSLVLKYIAKWDVSPNLDAADVTDDGKVNLADVSLLLKYIAKWDVVLK